MIRWPEEGWEYEADQRHAELIVEGMSMQDCKSVKTPGADEDKWELDENEEPLEEGLVTKFRCLAARANFLSLDRGDIQYATKETCRGMAKPDVRHWKMMRRLARSFPTRNYSSAHEAPEGILFWESVCGLFSRTFPVFCEMMEPRSSRGSRGGRSQRARDAESDAP